MGKRAVSKFIYFNSIGLTLLLCIVTCIGGLSWKASPMHSHILPLLSLILPLLLICNIIMILYWLIRFRIWIIIPIVALLANYTYIRAVYHFPTRQSSIDNNVNTLKIATFNSDQMGRDWISQLPQQIAYYMHKNDVDILCFQEFEINDKIVTSQKISSILKLWPYKVIPIAPDSTEHLQLAIYSRYRIKHSSFITFKDSKNCIIRCDLDINGKNVRLYNAHLQTTSASSLLHVLSKQKSIYDKVAYGMSYADQDFHLNNIQRAIQANYIRRDIEKCPYPIIVCGDFNSIPSSYVYHTVLGTKLQDGFISCGHGYMYTFNYFKHLLRIDYILTSKDFQGIDYYSPDIDFHSDHRPVIMTMKLKQP